MSGWCKSLDPWYSPWNSPGQNTGLGSLSLLQGIFPTQGSNPGLPHCRRILYQLSHKGSPTILEWVAYPFSSGSSQPRNWTGSPALQEDSLPAELSGKPMLINHLYIFFDEMSHLELLPILTGLFVFYYWVRSSLYILDTSLLSQEIPTSRLWTRTLARSAAALD